MKEFIDAAPLMSSACCARHPTQRCARPAATVDFTGAPCTPWSNSAGGNHRGAEDPTSAIPLTWARLVAADKVLVAIHENVS
eukprot:8596382-Pyramimonas_sp.AAC.1